MLTNPKRNPLVLINHAEQTPTILNQETGHMLVTNAVGLRVLELCNGTRELPELVQAISTDYPRVDRGALRADIESFLQQAADKGLVA